MQLLFEDISDVFSSADQAGANAAKSGTDLGGVAECGSVGYILVHGDRNTREPVASLGQHQKACAPGGPMIGVIAQSHGNPQLVGRKNVQVLRKLLGKQ